MKEKLKNYRSLISFLGETLGMGFEATLFDMTEEGFPVVASANSHSSIEDALREFVAQAAENERVRKAGFFANHPLTSGFSSLIKSSVYFITDEDESLIGAVCLSSRYDTFMHMLSVASDLIRINTEDLDGSGWEEEEEKRPTAPSEVSLDTITAEVRDFSVDPERMSQDERIEIILDLYDMGVFELKGAVARAAEELHISVQSVYRYITKIKKARGW